MALKTAADQFSDAGAGKQEALISFTFKVDEKIKSILLIKEI